MKRLLSFSFTVLLLSCVALHAQQGWVQINTNLIEGFNTVYITNSLNMFIGTEQGNIYKSTNGGQTLTATATNTTDGVSDIIFTSPSTAWAVGDDGLILKSLDTGNTWATVTSGVSVNLEAIFFADANTGYIAGRNGTILKTTNGGTSWSAQSSGTTNRLEDVWFTSATRGFVAGRDGSLLETSNGGSTWTNINLGTDDNKGLYFFDADTGFVAGENGIFKTTNGGSTWNATTTTGINEVNAIHFGSARDGYAVGELGTIGVSHNRGNNWAIDTVISGLAFTELNDVYFVNAGNGAIVGDAGTLLVRLGSGGGGNQFCHASYVVDTVHSGGSDVYIINNATPDFYNSNYTTSFFWDFGDGNSSNQPFPVHTYANSGAYAVCLTITSVDSNSNICVDNYCDTVGLDSLGNLLKTAAAGFTINILDPTKIGVKEYNTLSFDVYPNPATDLVNLRWPSGIVAANVQLITLSGQLLRTSDLQRHQFLDVGDLPAGTYLIKVIAEGETWHSTLVLN